MSGRTRAEMADQIRAGVAILNAMSLLQDQEMSPEDFGKLVTDLAAELFHECPLQITLPVAYAGLQLARLAAEAVDRPVEVVIEWLGSEAASL